MFIQEEGGIEYVDKPNGAKGWKVWENADIG